MHCLTTVQCKQDMYDEIKTNPLPTGDTTRNETASVCLLFVCFSPPFRWSFSQHYRRDLKTEGLRKQRYIAGAGSYRLRHTVPMRAAPHCGNINKFYHQQNRNMAEHLKRVTLHPHLIEHLAAIQRNPWKSLSRVVINVV